MQMLLYFSEKDICKNKERKISKRNPFFVFIIMDLITIINKTQ